MTKSTQTLRLEIDAHQIAQIWIDDPQDSVNTLKKELAEEFNLLLEQLEQNTQLKGLVFISGKADNFLAGANLEMLQAVKSAADGTALSTLSQNIQNRIANLPFKTMAAIHGACLGGGLELALAFDSRIATDAASTKLGLPEVQLGLLPGGGGTQRLPQLISIQNALDLLLTGKQIDAKRAMRMGLIDEVVATPQLLQAAIGRVLEMSEGFGIRPKRRSTWLNWQAWQQTLLTKTNLGKKIVFDRASKTVQAKTRGHYPAPEKILHVVREGLDKDLDAGFAAEAKAFGELTQSGVAKELINIFFATTELKKSTGIETAANDANEARQIEKIAVLGAGLMGAGISYVSINQANTEVRLKDRDHQGIEHGLKYVHKLVKGLQKRRRINGLASEQILARISGTTDYTGFSDADLVIEAVFEDLELKQQMLRDVEAIAKPDVIFASNTSTLPIGDIAKASAHPETVVGMHYFSPVEKMPLLEIIVTKETAPWVTASCVAFGKRQGKTVIVVNDGVGFYTTRILIPFLIEAATLVTEGIPVETIDQALVEFGFPLGPINLLDEVGIDVGAKIAKIAQTAFGDRIKIPQALTKLIEDQRFGRKNGRGFYKYDQKNNAENKQVDTSIYEILEATPNKSLPKQEIAERCYLQMINEAAYSYADGILRSPRDGDIGAIFGLGFPPFLGGPFRYIDAQGPEKIVAQLQALESKFGGRFAPAPILLDYRNKQETFYSA